MKSKHDNPEARQTKQDVLNQECLDCIENFKKVHRYDGEIFPYSACTKCGVGLKIAQLDNPKHRGLVGTFKPW